MPERAANNGWWGAVSSGDVATARVNWTGSEEQLMLPPGEYDVYWVQDHEHRDNPLLLAQAVPVEEGALTGVAADSGIALDLPEGLAGAQVVTIA